MVAEQFGHNVPLGGMTPEIGMENLRHPIDNSLFARAGPALGNSKFAKHCFSCMPDIRKRGCG